MLGILPTVSFTIFAVHEVAPLRKGLVEISAHDFPSGGVLSQVAADSLCSRHIGGQGDLIVGEHFFLSENIRTVVDPIQQLVAW
jgi:hypothetical protein